MEKKHTHYMGFSATCYCIYLLGVGKTFVGNSISVYECMCAAIAFTYTVFRCRCYVSINLFSVLALKGKRGFDHYLVQRLVIDTNIKVWYIRRSID